MTDPTELLQIKTEARAQAKLRRAEAAVSAGHAAAEAVSELAFQLLDYSPKTTIVTGSGLSAPSLTSAIPCLIWT